MQEKKLSRIEFARTLLQFQEILSNIENQFNALNTLLAEIVESNPYQYDELNSINGESATLESKNNLEINTLTRDGIEDSKETKEKPPIPPKPLTLLKSWTSKLVDDSKRITVQKRFVVKNQETTLTRKNNTCNENNTEKNNSNDSVIQSAKGKLKRKSSERAILMRGLDVFDAKNVELAEEYKSVEETRSSIVIKELIATEIEYVKNLEKIILYKTELETTLPSDIKDHVIGDLFCNIEEIHENHKKFLNILRLIKTETDVNIAFILMESIFEYYIPYARNKRKSDEAYNTFKEEIKNIQQNLNDSSNLSSYLLSPVQRLGQYVLLLGEIEKDLTNREQNPKDINLIKVKLKNVMKRIMNLLSIDKIKNVPSILNLNDEKSFILSETFKLRNPFALDIIAFLFQNVIVITVPPNDKRSECYYIKHLHLDTIKLIERQEDTLTFALENYDNVKLLERTVNMYEFEAKKPEIKRRWEGILRKLLWKQYGKMKKQATTAHIANVYGPVDYI